tara:strand:+ start:279 stop:470 length:192 start_codon:yes stop_codon:yes gene_type:complete
MKIKLLVNNKEIWDALNLELDRKIDFAHKQMEQARQPEDLYRLQGEVKALRNLKFLRDEVNGR